MKTKTFIRCAKKGQFSWFVALGMVLFIILAISLWIFLGLNQGGNQSDKILTEEELSKVKDYIQRCEKNIAEEAIAILGVQGGTITPTNYLDINQNKIEYAYDKGITFPSLEKMSREASNYISENVPDVCNPINATKRNVIAHNISTEVKMLSDSVMVTINWPITIQFDNNTKKGFDVTKFDLPSRMGRIHDTISHDLINYDETDLTEIETYDKTDIKKVEQENNIIAVLIDHKSKINNKPYRFFYAIRNVNQL